MSGMATNGTGPRLAGSGFDPALKRLAVVVVLGAIMSILDTTIVNVALRKLGADLHTSLSSIQWVTTGYMLALSMVIPLTGWAGGRFGVKRAWIVSLILFVGGSALCGIAWSSGSLIAFRVVQGIGGGLIFPLMQTILARAAGPQRIGRVMSVIGVPMMLGPVLGPVIGGLIVDNLSWRWIFYVNLPIGVIAVIAAWVWMPADDPSRETRRLDVTGLALLPPGLAALIYGLSEAGSHGSVTNSGTIVGVAIGIVLVGAYIFHALRAKLPSLVDMRLFANREFAAGAATAGVLGLALFGALLLAPLYYQGVRGQDALHAGLLMSPNGLGVAISMPIAGRLTDRIGAGRVAPVGVLLSLLGVIGFTQMDAHTSYVLLGFSQFVMGLGIGASMMPAFSAAYTTLRHEQVSDASPALNVVQRVGGSIGTALMAVVLARFLGGGGAAVVGASGSGTGSQHAAHAFAHTYWVAFGLIALAAVPAVLLPRRPATATEAQPEPIAA
jgi:EmrB/QacA subfamily drug resistance transporter